MGSATGSASASPATVATTDSASASPVTAGEIARAAAALPSNSKGTQEQKQQKLNETVRESERQQQIAQTVCQTKQEQCALFRPCMHERLIKETVQGITFLRWNCGSDPYSRFYIDRIDIDQNIDLDDRIKNLLHKLLNVIQDHQKKK